MLGGGGEPDVDLEGTWVLVSGSTADGPLAVTPGAHVSLTFDDDGLGGKGPCNDYGADYDLDGASFDVSGRGSSRPSRAASTRHSVRWSRRTSPRSTRSTPSRATETP